MQNEGKVSTKEVDSLFKSELESCDLPFRLVPVRCRSFFSKLNAIRQFCVILRVVVPGDFVSVSFRVD